jgi:hypothetical protein
VIFREFIFAICGKFVECRRKSIFHKGYRVKTIVLSGAPSISFLHTQIHYQIRGITKLLHRSSDCFAYLWRGAERRINASLVYSYLWKICGVTGHVFQSRITNSINPKSASTAWSKHILARSLCQAKGAANG